MSGGPPKKSPTAPRPTPSSRGGAANRDPYSGQEAAPSSENAPTLFHSGGAEAGVVIEDEKTIGLVKKRDGGASAGANAGVVDEDEQTARTSGENPILEARLRERAEQQKNNSAPPASVIVDPYAPGLNNETIARSAPPVAAFAAAMARQPALVHAQTPRMDDLNATIKRDASSLIPLVPSASPSAPPITRTGPPPPHHQQQQVPPQQQQQQQRTQQVLPSELPRQFPPQQRAGSAHDIANMQQAVRHAPPNANAGGAWQGQNPAGSGPYPAIPQGTGPNPILQSYPPPAGSAPRMDRSGSVPAYPPPAGSSAPQMNARSGSIPAAVGYQQQQQQSKTHDRIGAPTPMDGIHRSAAGGSVPPPNQQGQQQAGQQQYPRGQMGPMGSGSGPMYPQRGQVGETGPPPPMGLRSDHPPPARPAAGMKPTNALMVSQIHDEVPQSGPQSGKGPGSFSRIFLGSLEKYRARSGDVGTVTEEAAAAIAQKGAPDETKRTTGGSKGLTLRLRSPLALIEAVVLTALVPAVGFAVHRDDPFFLNGFCWIVFAPLLLGLRHGFAPAMVSAVLLNGMIAAAWRTQFVPMPKLPGDAMVGLTALAMLTGQFSDVWKRELVRLDGGFEVVRKQLAELMRSHFLLELSHDRLQERTGKGAPSLRETMLAVHRVAEAKPKASLTDLADSITEIFQTYTMVEVAGLHAVDQGRLSPEPMAVIGRPAKLAPQDEQVQTALTEKRLTYIETGAGREGASRTALIAVVPLVDAWGKLHGILAIESMPLLAFERRNLEALAIFGSHFADVIATGGKDVQRGQKKEFEIRLRRAIRDMKDNDVPSTIFGLVIRKGGAISDSIETLLGGTMRALDFPFIHRDKNRNYCIFILLPATDEGGARALGGRVERIVRRELNMNLNRAGAFHFFHVLRPTDTVEGVLRLLETKAVLDEANTEHTYVV